MRVVYRRERKVEFREDYFDTMPGMEIDKPIDQLLGKTLTLIQRTRPRNGNLRYWNTRLWNELGSRTLFFGPDAGSLDGERALARRIQLVYDLAALCHLREQSRRGKRFNWNNADETGDTIIRTEVTTIGIKRIRPLTPLF